MIKTPLSTMIGGAFWTPCATILGSSSQNLTQLIKSLFANQEQGFAYDPNDLTTLYQDAAGTIPVTAVGQPVGLIKDKSGRNNHAFQTDSGKRPLLQRNATTGAYYLAFDGADDFLQTSSIDFTSTDKVSLFAGVRKLSDATAQMIVELSTSNVNIGMFSLLKGAGSLEYIQSYLRGSSLGSYVSTNNAAYAAPSSLVVAAKLDINGATKNLLRVNAAQAGVSSVSVGTGNYGNHPLYIGRRAGTSLPFNGHIYGLIGIGRLTTDSETIALEKFIAKNTGVTLNV